MLRAHRPCSRGADLIHPKEYLLGSMGSKHPNDVVKRKSSTVCDSEGGEGVASLRHLLLAT